MSKNEYFLAHAYIKEVKKATGFNDIVKIKITFDNGEVTEIDCAKNNAKTKNIVNDETR